jgi:hypothetical protein
LKINAAIEEPAVIERIHTHLGLSAQPPPRSPARPQAFIHAALAARRNIGFQLEPTILLGPRLRVALKLRQNHATRDDVGFKKSSRDRNSLRTPCD